MTAVVRAGERYRSVQDGIESWHCFAAGGHYDPANVSFGTLIGCDEHLIAPGAGFDWHGHRGVAIVSWVLSGALRHEDSGDRVQQVVPGEVLVQLTGAGIRHREVNASSREPLRLVQMTLLGDDVAASTRLADLPVDVAGTRFAVWRDRSTAETARWHVFVANGTWRLGAAELAAGDSARGHGELSAAGSGELLVWLLEF
jgi:quercetin 2,3-dioxygenase